MNLRENGPGAGGTSCLGSRVGLSTCVPSKCQRSGRGWLLSQLPLPSAYSQCKTMSPLLEGLHVHPRLAQGRTRPDEGAGVAAFFPGQAGFIVGRKTNELQVSPRAVPCVSFWN